MQRETPAPIAVSISDAVRISGLGRSTLYTYAKASKLPFKKVGGRTLVMVDDLRRLIESEAA